MKKVSSLSAILSIDGNAILIYTLFMSYPIIYQQIFILFFIASVGFFLRRRQILSESGSKCLSKIVLYVTLPALILASVGNVPSDLSGKDILFILAIACLSYSVMGILAFAAPRLFRVAKEDRGIYEFLILFANVGFIGFPVLSAIYGSSIVFIVAIFNLPMNILCFTIGILMIAPQGTKLKAKALLTPAIIASVAAPILYLLPFHVPAIMFGGLSILGDATIPLAMILIGGSLAQIPLREFRNQPKLHLISLFRLILCPAFVWFVLHFFVADTVFLGTAVILAAMPSATNSTLLCIEYGGNEQLSSRAVCLTTLFSAVTIPCFIYFMI